MAIYETPPANDAIEALRRIEALAKHRPGELEDARTLGTIGAIAFCALLNARQETTDAAV